MFKNITQVVRGDIIIDSGNRTTVSKLEVSPEGCRHSTHVNEKDCYTNAADVRIQD